MSITVETAENGWVTITDEDQANEIQIRPIDEGILLGVNRRFSLFPRAMLQEFITQLAGLPEE